MNLLKYHTEPYVLRAKTIFQMMKHNHLKFDWNLKISWNEINFNRIALVNLLLRNYENPRYLEIGCASNALFDSVYAQNKVGVDPNAGGNVRKTSDEFFENNNEIFDVIFIDGLHSYEQARRDLLNSKKVLAPDGFIAFHDMLPLNWIEGHPYPIIGGSWTGDVWKLAFELNETSTSVFNLIQIDHGIGLIRNCENLNLTDESIIHYKSLSFSYYIENYKKLPLISQIEAWKLINEAQRDSRA
jgi:SAM-dependent methyltransferase